MNLMQSSMAWAEWDCGGEIEGWSRRGGKALLLCRGTKQSVAVTIDSPARRKNLAVRLCHCHRREASLTGKLPCLCAILGMGSAPDDGP